jgi:hypothetical protein
MIQEPDSGSDQLRQEFRELPKLEKGCIRIVGKVSLGKHPEPQELLVVRLEMGEVAGEFAGFHVGPTFTKSPEQSHPMGLNMTGIRFIPENLTILRWRGRKYGVALLTSLRK